MFMVSFRLRGKVVAGALALALVAILGVMGVNMLRDGAVAASSSGVKVKDVKVKTNEQRLAFTKSFGWEVQEDPAEVLEVIIPKEFDEVYEQYNTIQKKQGCDLAKYAGKRVKRYSYLVTNYPQAQNEVRLNILVYKDKVIGGDVCSLQLDGFMHGFELPS